jgi:hypothetical protein
MTEAKVQLSFWRAFFSRERTPSLDKRTSKQKAPIYTLAGATTSVQSSLRRTPLLHQKNSSQYGCHISCPGHNCFNNNNFGDSNR